MSKVFFGNCALVHLAPRGDERGQLIAIEGGCEAPFAIQRVYFIYETVPGTVRGHHAHRALTQLAVCVSGSVTMVLDTGRGERRDIRLDHPARALRIGPMIWREMHDFAPGTVLMVLADAHYDEADYIRNYAEFVSRSRGERS